MARLTDRRILELQEMSERLIMVCNIDGETHRMAFDRCDYKHVNKCSKNGRLCHYPSELPEHCKMVGRKADDCIIIRGQA